MTSLTDEQLLGILRNAGTTLRALHAHEVLIGLLADPDGEATTAATVALATLAQAQADGLDAASVIERHPGVLALLPPQIGPLPQLPQLAGAPLALPGGHVDPAALAREALRLRARWVQELTARAAWELGTRLAELDVLRRAEDVRLLRHDELVDVVRRRVAPAELHERVPPSSPPLPASFRLDRQGRVVPDRTPASSADGGTGAGGGRATGPVHRWAGDPSAVPDGSVLVVGTLDPSLAVVLPRLAGLVAETGSPLSHLAILARELGVATVVGHHDARRSLADGAQVLVDGATGEVQVVGAPPEATDQAREVCCP